MSEGPGFVRISNTTIYSVTRLDLVSVLWYKFSELIERKFSATMELSFETPSTASLPEGAISMAVDFCAVLYGQLLSLWQRQARAT